MTRFLVALVLLVVLPAPVFAQDDEEAVRAVVDRLFDAMRAGDSAAVRSVFHPDARLVSAFEREGQPVLQVEESMDGFVKAVGTPHDEVWDERIWDVEIEIDGRLAAVWAKYAFYRGDQFSHCGVDAFHLFEGPEGWKIFDLADTRRREGCETPPD